LAKKYVVLLIYYFEHGSYHIINEILTD